MHPRTLTLGVALTAAGCGASHAHPAHPAHPARMSAAEGAAMNANPTPMIQHFAAGAEDAFGPLEVGAEYATRMTLMNTQPFVSRTHGGRWVNVYVNAIGRAAYQRNEELPVGSVVVKESFEDDHGHPDVHTRGPLFVMERRAAGYAPARGDWWYAIWIPDPWGPRSLLLNGGALPPVYWRGNSARVQYCEDCHTAYDNRMGGVPEAQQAWHAGSAATRP